MDRHDAVTVVMDASAVLAIVFDECGADVALTSCRGAILSAVNLDEVLHKSIRWHIPGIAVESELARLQIETIQFDAAQARIAADLYSHVRGTDTSFADRACLSLSLATGRPVLTADGAWRDLGLDIDIRLIR